MKHYTKIKYNTLLIALRQVDATRNKKPKTDTFQHEPQKLLFETITHQRKFYIRHSLTILMYCLRFYLAHILKSQRLPLKSRDTFICFPLFY